MNNNTTNLITMTMYIIDSQERDEVNIDFSAL